MEEVEILALSVAQVAKALGISKPTAYELTNQPGFPKILIGEKRIVVPKEGLKHWLENSCDRKTRENP